MESGGEKRKRGINFTSSERELLIDICNKYKNVIENKKTDAVTWKQKEDTWNQNIQPEFNSLTNGPARSGKQLRAKYDTIKKDIKKQHTAAKFYSQGTGGGKYEKPPEPSTEAEKELCQTIAVSVEGLQSTYDSDAAAGLQAIDIQLVADTFSPPPAETKTLWSQPSAYYLQTPVHNALQTKPDVHHDPDTNSPAVPKSLASRRRPIISKKRSMTSTSAKFELLAAEKQELVMLEKKVATEKLEQNRAEHAQKMINLKLKSELIELKKKFIQKNYHNT